MSRTEIVEDIELGDRWHTPQTPDGWNRYLDGYPAFSAFLVNDPDKTGTIFRRFDRTTARNILYLESELAALEQKLDALENGEGLDDAVIAGARDWVVLRESARQKVEKAVEVEKVVLDIRGKVKEYQEALVLFNHVLSFASPERRALKANRRTFAKTWNWRQQQDTMIHDGLSKHLSEEHEQDLCALRELQKPDRLTRLFEGKLAFLFREKVNGTYVDYVKRQRVEPAVSAISSILAAVFLIGAVLGLYFVESQNARLGMLCGFMIAFAGSLALLTNAKRQEVFAATAAYAAVLVVFLSGDFAHNSGSSSGPSATTPTVVTVTSTVFASTNT